MHSLTSKLSRFIWLFIILAPLLTLAQSDKNDTCSEQRFENISELKERFHSELLNIACQRKDAWQKGAIRGSGRAAFNPILTPAQSAWANKLFGCFDLRCVCQMQSECKEILASVDPALGNETSTGKREPEKVNGTGSAARRKRAVVSRLEQLLTQRIGKATRKELRHLTDDERNRFFKALQVLKTDSIDGLSKYDIMIVQHTAEYSPGAHFAASFLPFHREFAKNLELSLRAVDPTVALHYWDPTLDQGLPDPRDSVLWSDTFLGNGVGDVTSGPFGNWTTVRDSQFVDLSPKRRIVRNVGASPYGSLYRDSDLTSIMNRNGFRDLVFCVDPYFELVHGSNHLWIGGHMNELRISPNDPVFFFLHTFVDYIWEEWRQAKQNYNRRTREYTSNAESCGQFSTAQAKMRPYSINNMEGLSNQYTDVLYAYEPRPSCSQAQPDCGSKHLFCHTGRWKCLSKVRVGGNCAGLETYEACLNGECQNGRCRGAWTATSRQQRRTTTPAEMQTDAPEITTRPSRAKPSPKRTTATTLPPTASQETPTNGETVWVPITVLSLNGRVAAAYPNARIVTTDQSTSQQLTGQMADSSQQPYYTGSAFAQVNNPFSPGRTGPVEASVQVLGENGKECVSMCQESGAVYNPCRATISLVAASQSQGGTPFAQTVELAKQLNWRGNRHTPDRFLFICPTGRSTASPATGPPPAGPPPRPPSPAQSAAGQFSVSTNGGNDTAPDDEDITIKIVHSINGNETKVPQNPSPAESPAASGPPSSSETTSVQNVDDCRDDHRCCPIWAAVGECNRNPWMGSNCRRLCKSCRPSQGASRGCADRDPRCSGWAQNGECERNDLWMEENCKRSCNVCQRSLDELKSMCGAAQATGECVNQHSGCVQWAGQWECVNNPWWMKENCPEACNYCASRSRVL